MIIEYEPNSLLGASYLVDYISVHIRFDLERYLLNILYLNERLFKFNMVENPLCSLCNQTSESVLHLFCTCTKPRNLWRQLCAWLANQNVMLLPNLEPQTAMLSLWNKPIPDLTLINHVILTFKCYIYLKKKETTGPTFFGLKAYIKNMETILA